jgi:Ca-activated chloride channel family protein
MRFDSPWVFIIVFLAPVWVWLSLRKPPGRLRLPTLDASVHAGRTWRNRLIYLPLTLRIAAVFLLVLALGRPQQGAQIVRDVSKGMAIEIVVDRSGSMGEEIAVPGSFAKRLDVVKEVCQGFVFGNGRDLRGRQDDLIGIISFARYAETTCPLTLSHEIVGDFMERIQAASRKEDDGTAIGDALALAAARLKNAEESLSRIDPQRKTAPEGTPEHSPGGAYSIKNKIIILLTDGHNNAGKRTPEQGAALAAGWGVRVYALGIGGAQSSLSIRTPFGEDRSSTGETGVDQEILERIASDTGGRFWLADSAEKLRQVYAEIDRLETSEITAPRFSQYSEKFTAFVVAALAAIFLELLLANTLLRRIP